MKYAQTREELVTSLIKRQEPMAIRDGGCSYDHRVNGGCAIGCQVSPALSIELQSNGVMGVVDDLIFYSLPKRMQRMGQRFLSRIQNIHDSECNYIDELNATKAKDGLIWNSLGRMEINKVIRDYNLDLEVVQDMPY